MPFAPRYVFEVSFEVVNKIGGIHTVIRTKAEETVHELKECYFLIGPYNSQQAYTEVENHWNVPEPMNDVLAEMRKSGVEVYTGTWCIPGSPRVILFDLKTGYQNIEGWRHELHQSTGIPIHVFDHEVSECIVFGGLVSWFLGELRRKLRHQTVLVGHFHEWNASVGLIFLRNRNVDISLIFTTHATLMGRHLSSGGCDLYHKLGSFNCDLEAGKRGFYSNHCIERCAAHKCHVFTTVSSVTADEAQTFLGRYPDVITPNGLPPKNFVGTHEFQNIHVVCKEIIHEFVRGHFFGSYYFDLNKTIYMFNAGRYEYSNKGVDILLEAVYRLNNILKSQNADVTVVLFLIFNANTNNFNIESLRNQAIVRQLRQSIEKLQASVGSRIFESVVVGRIPNPKELLESKEISELKKFIHSSRNRGTLPPVVTHNMVDDENDLILTSLRRLRLFNSPDDKVKIVFHPQFLTSTSPLFPIDYESFVRGCHIGIFPSYYEPWGYTPAECTNHGIPSVTTNLSGFGQFMEEHIKHPIDFGIYIVDRKNCSLDESINQLTHYMHQFVKQTQRERVIQRNRCERLCVFLEWKRLNYYYSKARYLAVERTHPDKLSSFVNYNLSHFDFSRLDNTQTISPRSSGHTSEDEVNGVLKTFENMAFNHILK